MIDHDVPIPENAGKKVGRRLSDHGRAARAMQIGDSIYCKTAGMRDTVRWAISHAGRGYCTREQPEGGWRVWRTA